VKKSAVLRIPKMNRSILFILLITVAGFIARIYNISSFRPISEDTALHSYVVYDFLNNHLMFYRDIWSPQSQTPISFILKAFSFTLFGYTPLGIRFISVILGTLTIPLVYLLAKKLYDKRIGLVSAVIFAVDIPYAVEISRWGYDLSYITPFVTLGIYFFACFFKDTTHRNTKLLISGLFLGTASIMKLYALPVIGAVLIVLLFENFRSKRTLAQLRSFIIQLGYFFLGVMIIPIITIVFVYSVNAWNQYIFTLANERLITITLTEKIDRFMGFVSRLFPMLLLCLPAIFHAFLTRKTQRLIPALWLIIPASSMFFIPHFIDSTLYYTSPAVMILASVTLVAMAKRLWNDLRLHRPRKIKLAHPLILIFITVILILSFINYQHWGGFLYSDKPQVAGQAEIADFIKVNTHPPDMIFTTDVSLAVLSQRSVIKVGSIKVAGFYSDLFGYDGLKYVGIPGHPQGIITPLDVLHAIQTQRPKLVILTKSGSGTFAAVDYLIFNGDPKWNTTGIGPWLERNYVFLKHIDNSYGTFDVWVDRNPRTLVFEDFEEYNFSFTGRLLTIQTIGEKTSYSFSIEQNQPIYGNYSARINYNLPGGENAYVQLAMKNQQPIDLSSFNSISIWIREDETPNVVGVELVDANGSQIGVLTDNLNFAELRNFIIPMSQYRGVDLSRITEIRISIGNNSQPHDISGEVYIDEIILIE
jgi:hypothetical protein